jgi:hypothetical protein
MQTCIADCARQQAYQQPAEGNTRWCPFILELSKVADTYIAETFTKLK